VERGRNYRFVYQDPTKRLPRECVATFLEEIEREYVVSLRPLAGTSQIPKEWVQAIYETHSKVMLPEIFRGEVRVL
jgi:hypothetical protein